MDPNIFIGVAVLFGTNLLTAGLLLVALKTLWWVFEWEDAWERKHMTKEEYYNSF